MTSATCRHNFSQIQLVQRRGLCEYFRIMVWFVGFGCTVHELWGFWSAEKCFILLKLLLPHQILAFFGTLKTLEIMNGTLKSGRSYYYPKVLAGIFLLHQLDLTGILLVGCWRHQKIARDANFRSLKCKCLGNHMWKKCFECLFLHLLFEPNSAGLFILVSGNL